MFKFDFHEQISFSLFYMIAHRLPTQNTFVLKPQKEKTVSHIFRLFYFY